MGVRVSGLRPISTSPITINTLSTIYKVIVDGILRPISNSPVVTTMINYFVIINTYVNRKRRNI